VLWEVWTQWTWDQLKVSWLSVAALNHSCHVNFCYIKACLTWQVLRLLQTFAGVLQNKIRRHAVSKETPTNYISTERLLNVELDKIMFCFALCFPKAAEAVNSKMTDWCSSELIGYQKRSFMQNNCAVLISKPQSPKTCQHFLLFLLVIFL